MAADAWGTPPWEIVETPGSARWMARLGTLRELQHFAARGTQPADEGFE